MTSARNFILISVLYGSILIIGSVYSMDMADAVDVPDSHAVIIDVHADYKRPRNEIEKTDQKKEPAGIDPLAPLDEIERLNNRLLKKI